MMSIEKQVAAARQQLTGESQRAARFRVRELPNWASLVPDGTDTQQLLESMLVQYIGASRMSGPFPLGIAEVVPVANRLKVRFAHAGLVRPALAMLPYRERGQRSVHGVPGLWARVVDNSIEIAFARHPHEGVIALTSLDRADLSDLLSAYESSLIGQRRVPLWTVDPAALPPEKFPSGRRRKPQPLTVSDHHRPAAGLASAVLRRIRLWDRLSGHAGIRMTAEVADHGLDWHLVREVCPGAPLHDDRLAAVLAEPVAGPGLVTDLHGHRCEADRCLMEFTAPAEHISGWDGVLRVESIASDDPAQSAPTSPRHFTALGENGFPSHGLIPPRPRPTIASHSPRSAPAASPNQARGRCVQLLAPRTGTTQWGLQGIATEIGAAWALEGSSVLVVTHSIDSSPEMRRLRHHQGLAWPSTDRPTATVTPPWRQGRLVPGRGSLFTHTAFGYRSEVSALLQEARGHFDWVIFVDCNDDYGMGPYVEDSVDSHVVVVSDAGYETSLVTAEARNGVAEHRDVPVSPAGSAMAWRHSHLTGLPLDRVPVTGLILRQRAHPTNTPPPEFTERVDAELTRFGTPVLTRLPHSPTSALAISYPTVLDQVPAPYRQAFVKACTALLPTLTQAEPCHIPPPAHPWR